MFRVPAWAIDAPTGDSLTYSNTLKQNRALVTHTLRPWIVRIERAISNDSDLCPGNTYVQFDLDRLLRADAKTRAETYEKALNADTGWLRRDEIREIEDLPPRGKRRMKGPEQRTVDVDVQDVQARGETVVGYAAVYGAEARIGDVTDTIAAGAFAPVLSTNPDVRALLNHRRAPIRRETRT